MNGGREVPLGINATVGAVVVVALSAVPSSVTGPEIDARLAVMAVGLVAFAAAVVDVAAAAISVGVGFLLFDGFVEGNHGDLVWKGRADLIRLGVLCLAAVVGLLIGASQQRSQRRTALGSTPSGAKVPSQRTTSGSPSEVRSGPAPAVRSRARRSGSEDAAGARDTPTSARQD